MEGLKDASLLRTACYIDGAWVGEPDSAVTDPATGAVIAHVPTLGAAETILAVEAAARAFPAWSALTGKQRGSVLRRWHDLVVAHADDLARILTLEQGKPLSESRGEIDYAASYIEYYAEEAKRVSGQVPSSHRADAMALVTRQPLGVVAAITPWNFPAAMITRKVAPALAAGCSVVVKPAPDTPLTALALAELAHRAGLAPGLLNVVTGDAKAIGGVLTGHRLVRAVSFTGSTPVGKLLAAQSATTVKRVLLELGGNAPFMVFDDANLDAAVAGAIAAKFRNSGQTCVCANRFYVQAGIHDRFVEKLAAAMGRLEVGHGLHPDTTLGPLINISAVDKTRRHVVDAISHGARLVCGGMEWTEPGNFYPPTLVTGATSEMLVASDETFGPLAAVFRFENEEEAIAAANASDSGLAAYLFSRDASRLFRVNKALEFGMVGMNTGLISSELMPFGGIKESGDGREGGALGIEAYTYVKYSLLAT